MLRKRIPPSARAHQSASPARQGCNWQPYIRSRGLSVPASTAISDEENSDSGDFAVTSDILPKKGRGRKPVKKDESVSEDDDVADTKVTNGDAGEEDDEDEDDEDMDEDE